MHNAKSTGVFPEYYLRCGRITANNSKKPLSSAAGYEALKDSLLDHKKDFVLFIMIPPPIKDDEVIFLLMCYK
jgi:hypothetical protein